MIEYGEADYGGAMVPASGVGSAAVKYNQVNDRLSTVSATSSSVFSWRPKSAAGALNYYHHKPN